MQPYAPRAFRFIELLAIGDWRMKFYGIAYRGELPRAPLLAAARKIARDQLSKETVNNYQVGFIGVHDGRGAAFVFVRFLGKRKRALPPGISFSRQRSGEVDSGETGGLVRLRLGSAFAIL